MHHRVASQHNSLCLTSPLSFSFTLALPQVLTGGESGNIDGHSVYGSSNVMLIDFRTDYIIPAQGFTARCLPESQSIPRAAGSFMHSLESVVIFRLRRRSIQSAKARACAPFSEAFWYPMDADICFLLAPTCRFTQFTGSPPPNVPPPLPNGTAPTPPGTTPPAPTPPAPTPPATGPLPPVCDGCNGVCGTYSASNTWDISDGSGGSTYVNYADCNWIFAPSDPSVTSITATFTLMEVEANYDFVTVYSCATKDCEVQDMVMLQRITGSLATPFEVRAPNSSVMAVTFTTDYSVVRQGFAARLKGDTGSPTPPPGGMPPWLMPEVIDQYSGIPECVETRDWSQIIPVGESEGLSMGGVGDAGRGDPKWDVWACWGVHSCLGAVGAAADDHMCYAYNEDAKTWHPWGLRSEVNMLVCNGNQPAVESVSKKPPGEVETTPEL